MNAPSKCICDIRRYWSGIYDIITQGSIRSTAVLLLLLPLTATITSCHTNWLPLLYAYCYCNYWYYYLIITCVSFTTTATIAMYYYYTHYWWLVLLYYCAALLWHLPCTLMLVSGVGTVHKVPQEQLGVQRAVCSAVVMGLRFAISALVVSVGSRCFLAPPRSEGHSVHCALPLL